jgi:predicted amidophosphoribosyltransferase
MEKVIEVRAALCEVCAKDIRKGLKRCNDCLKSWKPKTKKRVVNIYSSFRGNYSGWMRD